MLSSGALIHRVTIEETVEAADSKNDGFDESPRALYERVPAFVRPLIGRDLEKARQIDATITHEVTLRFWRRYHDDLDGGRCRLIYHGLADRTLEIVGPPVDVDERHVELRLTCREAA